jgi:predicted permease
MSIVLDIIAPVFGMIAVGWLAGRLGILGPRSGEGISDFAFTLGLPALLCRTVANAHWEGLSPLSVWASFYIAAGLTWGLATLATVVLVRRPAIDAPSIAMASVFGNTAMLGIPVAMATFGHDAAATLALVLSIHAPLLLMTGLLHHQLMEERAAGAGGSALPQLGRDLMRNPLIIGIAAGALWRVTGLTLPNALDKLLQLLAEAGVPASLVALGLTLVGFEIKGQAGTLAVLIGLKLVVMPVLAWALAAKVFALPPVALGVVLILAAMPAGANAYLFAVRRGLAANSASGAVALGTVLAAVTVSVVLSVVKP